MRYSILLIAALMVCGSSVSPVQAGAARSNLTPHKEQTVRPDGSAAVLPEDLKVISHWKGVPERHWAGSDFWCNRLQDWVVRDNWLHAEAPSGADCRTAHLITYELVDKRSPFYLQVLLKTSKEISSLGVFEHWDNDKNMKYSRNIDPKNGKGIEFFYFPLGSANSK